MNQERITASYNFVVTDMHHDVAIRILIHRVSR